MARNKHRGEYPASWPEIAARVKEAAGWRCERCGHPNRRRGTVEDVVPMTTESSKSLQAVRGRIGGLVKASKYPPGELTSAARAAFLRKFEQQVDPDNILPPEERARRAAALRKSYFSRLAYLSAKARRERAKRRSEEALAALVAYIEKAREIG